MFNIPLADVNEFTIGPVSDFDGVANSVAENAANATVVRITARAVDADATTNTVTYSLVNNAGGRFAIDAVSGVVTVADGTLLDFDAASSHLIRVRAASADGSASEADFTIALVNQNDNPPVITSNGAGATAAVNVAENATAVTTVVATDTDGTAPTYSIVGGADAARFSIDAATGVLTFTVAPNFEAPLDADGNNSYLVSVRASDGSFSDTQDLTVTVTDVNEFAVSTPVDGNASANSVAENAANGTLVGITAQAVDTDGSNNTVSYSLTDNAGGRFAIGTTTGVVTVANGTLLDYESATSHNITVQAASSDGSTSSAVFTVSLANLNDNAPSITSNGGGATASISVAEIGTAVTTVVALDADGSTPAYSIVGGADAARFSIDAATGVLRFVTAPDFENPADANADNLYQVTVRASDGTLTDTQVLSIAVNDLNEFAVSTPADTNPAANTVVENATNGTPVGLTARATDADGINNTVSYSLTNNAGGRFAIDAATGVVTVADGTLLDFETATSHLITVRAQSSDGSSATQDFSIAVADVNDNAPVITSNGGGTTASLNVAENSTAVTTVAATDADGATPVYSIVGGVDAARFVINASTGALGFVSAPDFEIPGDADADNVYEVTVQASDGSLTDTQALSVSVAPLNDNTPQFISGAAVSVAENSNLATTVTASDGDLPAETLAYSISGGADAARLIIDSATGALTFLSTPDYEAPADADGNNVYLVQVTVSDGTRIAVQNLAITVTDLDDTAPVLTSNGGGASAAVNVAENTTAVTTVTATDIDTPAAGLSYSIGGADAARFTIDAATGVLRFTVAPNFENPQDADADGIYQVTVQISDGVRSDSQALAITVTNVPEAPTGSPVVGGSAVQNQTLTVDSTSIADPDGLGTFSYLWLRDGVPIAGASGATYMLTQADVGYDIRVRVAWTDGGGTNEALVSAGVGPVANVNDAPTGLPTITGTPTEDQTLTVNTSAMADADGLGPFSLQWLRDGGAIAGASGTSYLLGDADVGRLISVRVNYVDGFGVSESVTSATTGPVANVNDAPTGLPVVNGTPTEDQTLTVDTATIADADGLGAFSVQWFRDGVAITGANVASYTLGDADVQRQISARVQYTDGQGTTETLTSAAVGPVANLEDVPTGTPVVVGTPTEDEILTADTGTIADADGLGPFGYQWLRDGNAIAGATGAAHLLTDADVGARLSVRVEWVDGGGKGESLTSAETAPVANVNDAPVLTPVLPSAPVLTEDEVANAGRSVAAIVAGTPISDADAGALQGIAVTGTSDGNGRWQYSLDGSTWQDVGSTGDGNALLLHATDRLRFVPDGRNGTSATLSLRAWDQTSGTAGARVDASVNGGSTAFSANVELLAQTVTDINDAPVMVPAAPALPDVQENAAPGGGFTVASLLGGSATDVDNGALRGIAITAADTAIGHWQYSIDGGASWTRVPALAGQALLLRAADSLRFVSEGAVGGTTTLSYHAWDQTVGQAGTLATLSATGGTTAFSVDSDTVRLQVLDVNDPPQLRQQDQEYPASMLIQPDGRILMLGDSLYTVDNSQILVLMRYLADGTPDASFDDDGQVRFGFPGYSVEAGDIALQPDGRIVVSLTAVDPGNTVRFAMLLRLTPDGELDASFGAGGAVYAPVQSDVATMADLELLPDGRIVATGYLDNNGDRDILLMRFLADGSPDASWGTNGILTIDLGAADESGLTLKVAADGSYVVGGYSGNDIVVLRYTANGQLDTGFNGSGRVVQQAPEGYYTPFGMTLQANGDIVLAVRQDLTATTRMVLMRFTAGGQPDTTWGTNGVLVPSLPGGASAAYGVLQQSDGKLVFTGMATVAGNEEIVVLRYLLDGTLDSSFGSGGRVVASLGSGPEEGVELLLDSNGDIVVMAESADTDGFVDFALLRFAPDGSQELAVRNRSANHTLVITEGAPAQALGPLLDLSDPELDAIDNYAGATLRIEREGGGHPDDLFSALGNLAPLVQGQDLVLGGVSVGTVTTLGGGVLELVFNANATSARAQEVIHSIGYANASDDPPTKVRIAWLFSDGNTGAQGLGPALTASALTTVLITPVNDAPTVTTSPGTMVYTEGGAAMAVDPGLVLDDVDSATLVGARVWISQGYVQGEDVLAFTDQNGISGSWDAATGTLTLTGTATVAQYQQALRSVTYVSTSGDPSVLLGEASFAVNDGQADSVVATRAMQLVNVNDAPEILASGPDALALEDGPPVAVAPDVRLTDVDNTLLAGATVQITGNYANGQDLLGFVDQSGISGSWNAATGTLTLAGSATLAQYEAALRSVTYQNTSQNPSSLVRSVALTVNDGSADSAAATRQVQVQAVNDAPVITSDGGGATAALGGDEGQLAVTTVSASDPDSPSLAYSISGGADAARFEIDAATGVLRFLVAPDFENPVDFDGNNSYEVQVQVSDGSLRAEQILTVTVRDLNDNAPAIASPAAVAVPENTTAVLQVLGADTDGLPLSYTIQGGADAARFAIDAATGALRFVAPPDHEAPLDADGNNIYEVQVAVSDANFTTLQNLTVTVGDANEFPVSAITDTEPTAQQIDENAAAGTLVGITALATDGDSTDTVSYALADDAGGRFVIDAATGIVRVAAGAALDFESASSHHIEVRASSSDGSFSQRAFTITLADVNDAPVITSGTSANTPENSTGVLTVAATDVDSPTLGYSISGGADAALFSIDANTGTLRFVNVPDYELPQDVGADNVYNLIVQVSDGTLSASQAMAITVTNVNEVPLVAVPIADQSATEDTAFSFQFAASTFADPDLGDTLSYSAQQVGGSALPGWLNFDAVTRTFSGTPANSDVGVVNIALFANDGAGGTAIASFAIGVANVNDAPVVLTSGGAAGYTLGTAPVAVDGGLLVSDLDSTQLVGASVAIGAGYAVGQDVLGFANQNGITGSWNAATGVLTLVGSATVADYQAALRSVTFSNSSNVLAAGTRTVLFSVNDGSATSATAIRDVALSPPNRAPVITSDGGGSTVALSVTENTTAVTTVTAADADGDALSYVIVGGADAGLFSIDGSSGVLRFSTAPDREAARDADGNNVYEVVVQVSDGLLGDTQALTVTVIDANDGSVGLVTDVDAVPNQLAENAASGTRVGITIQATDSDSVDTVRYSLDDDAGGRFSIDPSSGVVTVANGTLLDFETTTRHDITVRATSSDGSTRTERFTVEVANLNDFGVSGTTDTDTEPNVVSSRAADGALVGITVQAVDADAGAVVSYSLVDNAGGRFAIDPLTGVVTVANSALVAAGVPGTAYAIAVQIQSSDGSVGTASFSIQLGEDAIVPLETPPLLLALPGSTAFTASVTAPTDPTAATGSSASAAEKPEPALAPGDLSEPDADVLAIAASGRLLAFEVSRQNLLHPVPLYSLSEQRTLALAQAEMLLEEAERLRTPSSGSVRNAPEPSIELGSSSAAELPTSEPVVDAVWIGSTALSLGVAIWATRGGALLTSMLATTPAWQNFDPVPVLNRPKANRGIAGRTGDKAPGGQATGDSVAPVEGATPAQGVEMADGGDNGEQMASGTGRGASP